MEKPESHKLFVSFVARRVEEIAAKGCSVHVAARFLKEANKYIADVYDEEIDWFWTLTSLPFRNPDDVEPLPVAKTEDASEIKTDLGSESATECSPLAVAAAVQVGVALVDAIPKVAHAIMDHVDKSEPKLMKVVPKVSSTMKDMGAPQNKDDELIFNTISAGKLNLKKKNGERYYVNDSKSYYEMLKLSLDKGLDTQTPLGDIVTKLKVPFVDPGWINLSEAMPGAHVPIHLLFTPPQKHHIENLNHSEDIYDSPKKETLNLKALSSMNGVESKPTGLDYSHGHTAPVSKERRGKYGGKKNVFN
jgi:hypothetical protein